MNISSYVHEVFVWGISYVFHPWYVSWEYLECPVRVGLWGDAVCYVGSACAINERDDIFDK
jgi:hypothetical protein